MFRFLRSPAAAAALLLGIAMAPTDASAADTFPGVGRAATDKEVRAWDIDVRPDFKGLPPGSGTVAKGQDIWETRCMSCHGVFGESNEVFNPLVGGTTKEDIKTGRVARLTDEGYPARTTMMKLPTLSTLWDYINRAMPWNQPKSLTANEVYAVTAFILNLAGVLPDDFELSDKNIGEVQNKLPNRNGTTLAHAMWAGKSASAASKVDVQGSGCMRNCTTEPQVASFLPDFARNAHGNLAEQNRIVGAQRGAVTADAAAAKAGGKAPAQEAKVSSAVAAQSLLSKHACVACHSMDAKIVGPSFQDVAKRYAGKGDAVDHLAGRITAGGSGTWGPVPMPPQALPKADAALIAQWLAAGAPRQ